MRTEPALRPYRPEDAAWLVDRHRALYAQDEGYDDSFGDLVATILDDFARDHDPAREQGWVAMAGKERLGSIFCMAEGPDFPRTARLRLFLLEPGARGTGLATGMMDTCLGFARDAGYREMRLWTHASHVAACRLYARHGFSCTQSWNERTFGQDVVSQIWERAL